MTSFKNERGGGVLVFVFCFLLIFIFLAAMTYFGYNSYKSLVAYIEDGRKHIYNDQFEIALKSFQNAENEFNFPVKFFQKISQVFFYNSEMYSLEDIYELISTSALAQAYEEMFTLNPATKWLDIASKYVHKIKKKNVEDLKLDVATAKELSKLCQLFIEKKYEDVLRKLLEVEKKARSNDLDFFIIEIRLLIACGKALGNDDILHKTRELLFFATYDAQIKNKKIDQLWSILNK